MLSALFLIVIGLAGKTSGESAVFRVVGYAGAAFAMPVAGPGAGADHGFVVGAGCVFHMRLILQIILLYIVYHNHVLFASPVFRPSVFPAPAHS